MYLVTGRYGFIGSHLVRELVRQGHVLHHAAVASVPESIRRPEVAHAVNVTGTLNVLIAASDAGVRRVVFASSSAVYADGAASPRQAAGRPLGQS